MVPWKSLPMPCKELPPKLMFSQDVHFRDLYQLLKYCDASTPNSYCPTDMATPTPLQYPWPSQSPVTKGLTPGPAELYLRASSDWSVHMPLLTIVLSPTSESSSVPSPKDPTRWGGAFILMPEGWWAHVTHTGETLQPALPHENSSPLPLRTHHPHPRRFAPSSHHQLYPEISTHYSLSKGLSHDTLSPTLQPTPLRNHHPYTFNFHSSPLGPRSHVESTSVTLAKAPLHLSWEAGDRQLQRAPLLLGNQCQEVAMPVTRSGPSQICAAPELAAA